MPQVPYDPVPQTAVQPDFAQGPRVETPGAAFGTNIAEAIKGGGQTLAELGARYQAIGDEANAREASIAATQEMAKAQSDFDNLEGAARSEALMPHLKNLNDIRQKYKGTLSLNAGRMYDAEAASLMNRFTAASAARAGEGLKQAATTTAAAHEDLISNQWVDPLNDNEFDEKRNKVGAAVRTQVANSPGGFSEDKYEDALQKATSKLWYIRIEIVGRTDPQKAWELFGAARAENQLTSDHERALNNYIIGQNRAITGDLLAEQIYNEGGTLDEMRVKAKERAPGLALGDDVEFTRRVLTGIEHNDVLVRQAALQQTRLDQAKVLGTIEQTHPASEREFLAGDPDAVAAYHRLREQGKYPHGLGPMLTQKVGWDEDSLKLYNTVRYGEAESDPDAFLKRDVVSMPIPNSAKLELLKLQDKKRQDPSANISLITSFNNLRALYPNTIPDPSVDKEGAMEYKGALYQAIHDYMQEKKVSSVPFEDLKKIGLGLNATVAVPGMFGPRQQHVYELQPPSVVMDAMRARGKDDDTIIRDYRRARAQEVFQKLFGGAAGKPEEAPKGVFSGAPTPPQSK